MADRTTAGRLTDALVSVLAGVAATAGSFALAGWSRDAFVVAPIDARIVSATPGPVVAFAIEEFGTAGHVLHITLALAVVVGGLGLATAAALAVSRRAGGPPLALALSGLFIFAGLYLPTGALQPAILGTVSAMVVVGVYAAALDPRLRADTDEYMPDDAARRQTLGLALGTVAYAGVGAALGSRQESVDPTEPLDAAQRRVAEDRIADADALSFESGNLGGMVTPNADFYETDIATFDPDVEPSAWELQVTGSVEETVSMDYYDLTGMAPEHRFVTLRCVGEDLNGHKLDNALWTGVPIAEFLDRAGPSPDCGCVKVYAADDYYQVFPLEVMETAFLAYGMNGQRLPASHGKPARLLVPGHWGEINVKWVTEIELIDEQQQGYWEERGWHGTGPVNTVAKLYDEGISVHDDGRVELVGHAYAGLRGIDRVEVSTDGGDSWTDAELSEPLPDEDVWRMYRYEFQGDGEHELVVRATDGTGALQPEEQASPYPNGASGWVSKTIDV
ncbi:molybdopterin-dependent oxidoreductase [Haloarchaeobius iranensis]|uniref:DMSO/TMAO reductase YedYZ, molybdopterin-dependent catalytic subunit n=1 Tax=Haloarchaeobius iranensis TaxID=996166 RepID=A0A1G9YYX1_9EURY|nr:molybdopterin-dependent oxidoreductase [Haloarchaeobius iranensis]SDN13663.1 DMSO/TMAO reductase YedYZ, molybdopterin-dependent catalytic subunit [Haloarchaeobius iranensis]